jgi:thymidylate synthase ThyX
MDKYLGSPTAIFVMDGREIAHPEDQAMIQALYSRNPGTVLEKMKDVGGDRAGKLMSTYYVGYGDDSIGDCGMVMLFIENVSMIAAKVIQHHPLYNGQEASTRYLDFSRQGAVDPLDKPGLLEFMFDGYKLVLDRLITKLKEENPFSESLGVTQIEWEKTCKARAFDIARGLLPCGTKTSLSWLTSLRNARDHLPKIATHPSSFEMRSLATRMYDGLYTKYPRSFKPAIPVLNQKWFEPILENPSDSKEEFTWWSPLKQKEIDFLAYQTSTERGRREPIHPELDAAVTIKVNWELDYGSFRDIQRHRNNKMNLPIVSKDTHFHPWYMTQLADVADDFLAELIQMLDKELMGAQDCYAQYYMPLMSVVPVSLSMFLGQAVYIAETRSSRMVHPTLRPLAQRLGEFVESNFEPIKIHIDRSENTLNYRRGKQDIVRKENVT